LFENDWMMRQIKIMVQAFSALLFGKDTGSLFVELPEQTADSITIDETALLAYTLGRLIRDNKLNEAENRLFESIETRPTAAKRAIAAYFYQTLAE